MMRLVECVPNFSEGRRMEVVDQIVKAITDVQGIKLLDRESDKDHNRSVITFIGDIEPVLEAAFQATKKAAELIDMEKHKGEHPRIGATDVIPFIPISEVTMAECVEMANRLGKRIADELGIPVYLYEEAAKTPARQNLADIRKGQYEGLKEAIQTDPLRKPDYGPCKLHPTAGATVVGAREVLVAFNVNLGTNNIDIAKKI
ncbi:MAG: glutamate formimidoyltransferase, partial [Thermoplasmata archaeon]